MLTAHARRTIRQAVRLEHENTVIAQMMVQGKMDALKNLVASFTHEINTPIGVVISSSDLTARCIQKINEVFGQSEPLEALKSSRPLQKSLEALHTGNAAVKTAGTRISTIVNSLKSMVRLDEADVQRVDLHEALDNSLILLEHKLEDRIAVVREYGDLPPVVCSPAEINQVLFSILTNAVQAIDAEGTITIRTAAQEETITIHIVDTGKGMPSDRVHYIFEPQFTRSDTRVKAGLGLFTSYNIIQNHHGDLKIESAEGKGATVVIMLPRSLPVGRDPGKQIAETG